MFPINRKLQQEQRTDSEHDTGSELCDLPAADGTLHTDANDQSDRSAIQHAEFLFSTRGTRSLRRMRWKGDNGALVMLPSTEF